MEMRDEWSQFFPKEKPLTYSFVRSKNDRNSWRIAYVIKRTLNLLLGEKRTLKLLLNVNLYSWRLAFELMPILKLDEGLSPFGAVREFLEMSVRPGARVLDVGCADGKWSQFARNCGGQVIGIDLSKSQIEEAQKIHKGISFLCISVEDFVRTLKSPFDVIIFSHVLEHLDDPRKLLRELRHFSKTLVIDVPDVKSNVLNLPRMLLQLNYFTDADHVREYSLETLTKLLLESGFSVRRVVQRGGTLSILAR